MSLLSVFVFILPFICEGLGALIQNTVGADIEFPLSEQCRKGEGTLYQRLDDASTQLIASLNGYWKPGRDYTDRVIVGRDSLLLTNANFNDNGHYEFTCNKKYLEAYKLEVFLPSEVVVSEGGDAILPCRSGTAGQSVKSARWMRNGKEVLHLDAKTGKITYGEDFDKSRVSIPSDWDRRADLSLIIKGVQKKDGGVYYCGIEKAEKHRSAVRLRVRKPPESSNWTWITIIITAAVTSVIVFTLVFFWGWRAKTKSVHA